jgi:transcription antitermination factor NusG
MQHWLTIQTKPDAVGRAYIALEACGWSVFAPFQVERYRDRGLICYKAVPLFGPYLFVLMAPDRITRLEGIEGIQAVLRRPDGRPCFADDAKIDELKRARDMGAFNPAADTWAKAGDDVRIADTALRGFVAKLKNTPRHKRVELVCPDSPFRITAAVDRLEKIRA